MTLAQLDELIVALPPKLQSTLAGADPEGECQVCRSLNRTKAKSAPAIFNWHIGPGLQHKDRAWVIYALAGWAEVPK